MKMANFEQINQSNKSSKKRPISACEQSPSALVDLIILIAVIVAYGFLTHPYATLVLSETVKVLEPIMGLVSRLTEDVASVPMVYSVLGLAIVATLVAMLSISLCKSQECGQLGCRGLQRAVGFDIRIEREDCITNSDSMKCGLKKNLFELPRGCHKELEAKLKKMVPPNGRVVFVFRGRCGCPVVRMEVPGPKKTSRKMKK